jgi:hypothetical protein
MCHSFINGQAFSRRAMGDAKDIGRIGPPEAPVRPSRREEAVLSLSHARRGLTVDRRLSIPDTLKKRTERGSGLVFFDADGELEKFNDDR